MATEATEPPQRTSGARSPHDLPAFASQPWQMSYGERTAIEGMLAMIKPQLAIEIGRAEGGSLRRIAEHSEEVISFDVVDPPSELAGLPNVKLLTGDSHVLLAQELQRLAEERRRVDFVLVDGDHSAVGVQHDMQDLLHSPAISSTVILAHDTLNEQVRSGLEEVDYAAHEKVVWVDLDFLPGYVARLAARLGECWGGIGLVVVDAAGTFHPGAPRRGEDLFEQPKLIWPAAQWIRSEGESSLELVTSISLVADSELTAAQHEVTAAQQELSLAQEQLAEARRDTAAFAADLQRQQAWLHGIEQSVSWRLTSPLRTFKRSVRKLV